MRWIFKILLNIVFEILIDFDFYKSEATYNGMIFLMLSQ
jgi:hypothetical protein